MASSNEGFGEGVVNEKARLARSFQLIYNAYSRCEARSANVAQLVEQLTRNEQVSGSSPLVGSRN